MGNRKIKLWTAIAFFMALVVTVLPVVRRISFCQQNARQLAALEARVNSLDQAQLEKQQNLAKWYNYGLEQGDPGVYWAYSNILDFGDGVMAVLEVQELNLRLPIFHGTEETVGHDFTTPFPIGGRGQHTVLILRVEYDWEAGMPVYIDCLGKRITYQVESVQVMPGGWSTARPAQAGQDLLTLVFDRGNARTLIRCVRCVDLTVRPLEQVDNGMAILTAALPMLFFIPALCAKMRCGFCAQTCRLFGFFHKNRGKSNLY